MDKSCPVLIYILTVTYYVLYVQDVLEFMEDKITNSVVAEHKGSTLQIPQPTPAHDPEPVPSTSHPHNLFP